MTISCRSTSGLSEIGRAPRLNSSHLVISYAVFCLKKKTWNDPRTVADATKNAFIPSLLVAAHRRVLLTWYYLRDDRRDDEPLTPDLWSAQSAEDVSCGVSAGSRGAVGRDSGRGGGLWLGCESNVAYGSESSSRSADAGY